MLRRIFGAERDEVTGWWRKLHTEELNDLYCSPDIVKSSPVTSVEWPRGFQEVKVPRFHDNSTGWW